MWWNMWYFPKYLINLDYVVISFGKTKFESNSSGFILPDTGKIVSIFIHLYKPVLFTSTLLLKYTSIIVSFKSDSNKLKVTKLVTQNFNQNFD